MIILHRLVCFALLPAVVLVSLTGCQSDTVDPTKGFSASIQNLISPADIEKLRARGMPINEGQRPPSIEGIYVSSPHQLVSPYGPDDTYAVGHAFADLVLRFSNQNSTDLTATVDLKNAGSTGSGVGGFLAGNGSTFTFFAEIDLVSGNATAKQVRIFSVEITPDGIKDLYTTLLITGKNDPDNTLIPVGVSRIIRDGNGLASVRSTFRRGADGPAQTGDADR